MRSFDAVLLGSLLIGAIAAPATAGESTQFEILSLTRLPSQSVAIVRGVMRGTFVRPWDPQPVPASYKVPVWLAYPLQRSTFNRVALLEPMHPGGGNDFLMRLSRHTQEFNALVIDPSAGFAELDLLRLLDGADPLWRPGGRLLGGHFAYATTVAERSLLQLYKAPGFQQGPFHGVLHGIAIDSTFVIPRGVDRLIVSRDLSKLVQDPKALRSALQAFITSMPEETLIRSALLNVCAATGTGCAAERVIAGAFSAQAPMWRDMQFMHLNTGFAHTVYDDGFEFPRTAVDGVILGGVRDSTCRDYFRLPNDPTYLCAGAPPPEEGRTFIVNTEDDVQYQPRFPFVDENGPQFLGGFMVRGSEGANSDRNYRTYEIAAATHLATFVFDPIAAGFVNYPDVAYPSWVDTRPVYRAMIENMRYWAQHGVSPPANALLALGQQETVSLEPAFPFPPPPDPPEAVFGGPQPFWVPPAWTAPSFDRARQYDLSIEGGVRLPHVRTTVTAGPLLVTFGAPLGVHRPFACANFTPLTAPFDCPALVQFQVPDYPPGFLFGDFIPYKDLDAAHPQLQNELNAFGLPNPCDLYYPTREAYDTAVRRAAAYAALQRWILVDDIDDVVRQALARTAQFRGCVPEH